MRHVPLARTFYGIYMKICKLSRKIAGKAEPKLLLHKMTNRLLKFLYL